MEETRADRVSAHRILRLMLSKIAAESLFVTSFWCSFKKWTISLCSCLVLAYLLPAAKSLTESVERPNLERIEFVVKIYIVR